MFKGVVWGGRPLYLVSGERLLGYFGFGVIDRGTNVLQVRPTTLCPLNCVFCSVDAGPHSRRRWAEFIVERESIVDTFRYAVKFKRKPVEALIDTIGDPFTYPNLEELVSDLKTIGNVRSVAVETHGALLTVERVRRLEASGLDRINLSIDTLDPVKARFLQGTSWLRLDRVVRVAEYIARESRIDLHVTPVWIPGVNDKDIEEIAKWAYRIGAGGRWPPVTVQKYNVHRYGRRVSGVIPLGWREFWRRIGELERRLGLRVRWSMEEWGMSYDNRVPCPHRRGGLAEAIIVSRGVWRNELIGVTEKGWLIALNRLHGLRVGDRVSVEVISDKDCLLIGRVIGKA